MYRIPQRPWHDKFPYDSQLREICGGDQSFEETEVLSCHYEKIQCTSSSNVIWITFNVLQDKGLRTFKFNINSHLSKRKQNETFYIIEFSIWKFERIADFFCHTVSFRDHSDCLKLKNKENIDILQYDVIVIWFWCDYDVMFLNWKSDTFGSVIRCIINSK